MAILGLMTAESFADERFKNIRRSVFYFYPNGAAPLMGLLSMMKEEVTNDPEFKWYEKRMQLQRTTTAAIASTIVIYKTVSLPSTFTVADANLALAINTQYGIKVVSNAEFRVDHLIKFNITLAGGDTQEVIGRVTGISSTDKIAFMVIRAAATIDYDAAASVGEEVFIVGNAAAEGQVGGELGSYELPVEISNYAGISRTAFRISGTALKTSAKYDETGPYADQAKDYSVKHMIEQEKVKIFGEKHLDTSTTEIFRYSGGILWYLRQWEAANSIYRGGTGAAAITADTNDDKRIVTPTGGYLTPKLYNKYLERVFRVTNNKTNEKLAICGSGFLNVVNEMYEGRTTLNSNLPSTDTYGMNVTAHETPFGTIYYKTHPLFTQNPVLRNNCLIIDVHNLKNRPVKGRDTELLTERQIPNADYREDEWFTESGLEFQFPESAMYLQGVVDHR